MNNYELFSWSKFIDFDRRLKFHNVLPLGLYVDRQFINETEDTDSELEFEPQSDFVRNYFHAFRFDSSVRIKIVKIQPGEPFSFRAGNDHLQALVGEFDTLEVSFCHDVKGHNGDSIIGNVRVRNREFFSVNGFGEAQLRNRTEEVVYKIEILSPILIHRDFNIESNLLNLELPIRKNVYMRIAYLRAKNGFDFSFEMSKKLSRMGCFPDSLSTRVKLYVLDKDLSSSERDHLLFRRTLASLFPLNLHIKASLAEIEADFSAQPDLDAMIVVPAGFYIIDLEYFIYSVHQKVFRLLNGNSQNSNESLGEAASRGIQVHCPKAKGQRPEYLYADAVSKRSKLVDLLSLQREDAANFYSQEELIAERVAKALNNVFATNILPGMNLKLNFSPNTFVSVCSGLMPLAMGKQCFRGVINKSIFIDQNYRAVSMWRDLAEAKDIEHFRLRLSVAHNASTGALGTPVLLEWPKETLIKFASACGFENEEEIFSKLSAFGEKIFLWDNFIERPFAFIDHLTPSDRPFVWLSNSFYSMPSYHLYTPLELDRRFEILGLAVAQKLKAKCWRLKRGFKLIFGEHFANPVGVVWDDELNQDFSTLSDLDVLKEVKA